MKFSEIVKQAVGLDEQLLEKILGFGLAAGQPPREAIQAVEMRPHDALEVEILLRVAHCAIECIVRQACRKDAFGTS